MWRSLAARSTQLVARGFHATQMHQSTNLSDESLGLAENEDPELNFIIGIETNDVKVLSFESLADDETQMR
ncbi:hypothetical protein V6N13_066389 [Hibiscus sabdariffa]|uniref:Uncharacterized protein n=1 Tax=Hibiscus sabdariffa TaxID=183260 RepID=A0ABR2DQ95_9ROSI